jgi:hypothetical protein
LSRIWETLQKWEFDVLTNTITVATLTRVFSVVCGPSYVTFEDFDPLSSLGGDVDYGLLWRTLISNGGVLIVGPNPDRVSSAVFALISLVSPLQYREPVLAYTRIGDPRFADVITGSTFWKIVGTTNILAYERCKQFRVVLKLDASVWAGNGEVRKVLQFRTRKLLQKLESELDDMLEEDPYSDILGVPLPKESFGWIASDTKTRSLTLKEALRFQDTMTFAYWRQAISMRPALREAFLSYMPDELVAGRALEELAVMEVALRDISKRFATDCHLVAVAKRHAHLIRKERRRKMENGENVDRS